MIRIGITIGDPNGIGPEIALKAVSLKTWSGKAEFILFGETGILAKTAQRLRLSPSLIPHNVASSKKGIRIYHCPSKKALAFHPGKMDANAGAASLHYVKTAADLALRGKIDALVTCPISKEAVIASGVRNFTGHTEYLAERFQSGDFSLALWHGNFRVAHVSCHVSLAKAIIACKKSRIVRVGQLLNKAIKAEGIRSPRLGVAGLNPHAGENGAFGNEEKYEIIPAIRLLNKQGIRAEGPIPPDIIFAKMKAGVYDGVVAMYHDQGHIATKTLFFSLGGKGKSTVGGVNVSLGFPIVRTSVDHGTSFDIAGKGIADPTSLVDAIDLAIKLSRRLQTRL